MSAFVYLRTTALLLSISVWFLGTQISQHATWSNKELTGADWREFTPAAQCLPSSNKHALSCPYCVRSPCSPLCKHPPLYPITTIFRPRAGSDLIPNIRPSLPLSGGERCVPGSRNSPIKEEETERLEVCYLGVFVIYIKIL